MATDISNVVPLVLAKQILDGFAGQTVDNKVTPHVMGKIWEAQMESPLAGELTLAYNRAAATDEIGVTVSRLLAGEVLKDLIDLLHGIRMVTLKNEILRQQTDHMEDLRKLETYLDAASQYVATTYDDDGMEKYYDPEIIIETAINNYRNSALIGDGGIVRAAGCNLH